MNKVQLDIENYSWEGEGGREGERETGKQATGPTFFSDCKGEKERKK